MQWIFPILLYVVAAPAAAQVHKCIDGSEVIYQSHPCPSGQTTVRTWENRAYAPPSDPEVRRVQETIRATRHRDGRQSRANTAGINVPAIRESRSTRRDRCAAARNTRERELARIGLKRSFDTLQSWDEYVRRACSR